MISSYVLFVKNCLNSRELIYVIYKRDLLASFKKSFLGYTWLLISPILAVVSWLFMQGTGLLSPGETDVPYPVYVLVGTTFFNVFALSLMAGSQTLSAGAGFISQVNYPHDILFLKNLMQYLTGFLISLITVFLVMIAFGILPDWKVILLPILLLPTIFLGGGIGLLISIFEVVSNDVSQIVNRVVPLLMFITPVVYSAKNQPPLLQAIIDHNPLTYLLEAQRACLIGGRIENLDITILLFGITFLFLGFCLRFFYSAERRVIEKII